MPPDPYAKSKANNEQLPPDDGRRRQRQPDGGHRGEDREAAREEGGAQELHLPTEIPVKALPLHAKEGEAGREDDVVGTTCKKPPPNRSLPASDGLTPEMIY